MGSLLFLAFKALALFGGSGCLALGRGNFFHPLHFVSASGFSEAQSINYKGKPLVMKFTRTLDASWRPFELHLARCSKWGKSVEQAVRTSRTAFKSREERQGRWEDADQSGATTDA